MNDGVRTMMRVALRPAMLLGLLGAVGCSDGGTVTVPKASVEKKRDDLQKATQSGIPGKPAAGPGATRP